MSKKNLDTRQLTLLAGVPTLTLKELRKRAGHTQDEMALALGVGQDTVSRLEKRDDMLLSTLRHYVESIGGQLSLVVTLPGQPPVQIAHRDGKKD
ncbi:helix-turn-helix domain-containing protein [Pusillimonas minor]|uniref:Helix-turn-helix transcriptional regulator n=1 Tax=Pusillimonas minor TaxID=2697024 RepID=A0A842HKD5_9BURK|nr:helix-turn-helix transcriptional regulator [Pusillimonas minor]MBC2768746.1 helix-turn-helix transcriptional regulator [Pusillimonas minor]